MISNALVLLLAAGSMCYGGGQTANKSPATIVIEASYPGANASTVADTVAAPIEQEVNGIENLVRMVSRSSNDGKYVLAVTFKPGTDLNQALLLVQNRVALAQPILPELVKRIGITVRKKAPVRMLVTLTSPNNKYDLQFLSNYAAIQVKDELTRIAGVGEVTLLGTRDYSMRVWLDPQKLAVRNLTAKDVVDAIRAQNIQIPAGRIGQPPVPKGQQFEFKLETIGRLTDPSDLDNIVVKTRDGVPVRVKDLAIIELGADSADSFVSVNGKPGVVLAVYPTSGSNPKELSQAIAAKIADLQGRAPAGLKVEVAFDFTINLESPRNPKAAEYLLLDVQLPIGASMERARTALLSSEKLLRGITGVQDVVALSENPLDILRRHQPCLLVRLAAKIRREDIIATIRAQVAKIPDAMVQLRDLSHPDSSPGHGYPIKLAVSDHEDHGLAKLKQVVEMLAERLQKSKKLTDVSVNQASMPRPSLDLDIDRAQAKASGVAMQDIFDTLQIHIGSLHIDDFNRFGRTWQVNIQATGKFRDDADSIKRIKVRNSKGEMVPLGAIATLRSVSSPGVVMRLNMYPMIDITANPAANVSANDARRLCETVFEQMRKEARLSSGFRLSWLQSIPSAK